MNKPDLVEQVTNQTGLTRRTSRETVNAVISAITDSLGREEKVTLLGFGTFQVMERKARRGLNPRTGEGIYVSAKDDT
jgi:nucleoid DNA-binding protein